MSTRLKKYFLPHSGNNFHPHFFRKTAVLSTLVVLIGLFSLLSFVIKRLPQEGSYAAVYAGVLVSNTNAERQALSGGGQLATNQLLAEAAQEKADDMAARGYFSHVTPDGKTPWYWLDNVGYTYKYAGENLAVNFVDSQDVSNAWLASPAHRANLLNPVFKEVGIATAVGIYKGQSATFVVQFFGTPADSAVAKKVESNITPTGPAAVSAPDAKEKQVAGAYIDESSVINKIITSPAGTLAKTYYYFILAILLLVLGAALYEFKKHHKAIWLAGGVLVVVAGILLTLTLHLPSGGV